jgi:hypothetical protein
MTSRFRQLLPLAVLPLLLSACAGSSATRLPAQEKRTDHSAVREPTLQELAKISSTVNDTWKYESEPPGSLRFYYHVRLRRPRLRPKVVSVRISRVDPRYASAVVELRHAPAGRRRGTAVLVLKREKDPSLGGWGYPVAGPAIYFPLSCTAATPKPLRNLLCPDPWSVLNYPRPHARAQTAYSQQVPSPDLHAIDWRKVTLPGGVCGSSRPIRPHKYRYGPEAVIHTDVDLLWWNPVVVSSWSRPVFGDLDADGRDEAALQVVCANGGGTAAGQLAFSAVIFRAMGRSVRVVGIVTPQQPLDPKTSHVPLNHVVAIKPGQVVVSEAWYGQYDGTCCASGEAKTIWMYGHGKLRPTRTTILQKPWSSPLHIDDVLGEPGDQELGSYELTRVVATQDLRFAVTVNNEGHVAKRNIKVTLTIKQSPSPIVKTRTISRITSWPLHPPTVIFAKLGRLQLGTKTTVTIDIDDPGTNPVRYPVIFTRG